MQEKLSNLWLDHLLGKTGLPRVTGPQPFNDSAECQPSPRRSFIWLTERSINSAGRSDFFDRLAAIRVRDDHAVASCRSVAADLVPKLLAVLSNNQITPKNSARLR